MTTAPGQTATSCELGGHVWDLRYTATALRLLQMTFGSLEQFAVRLIKENMGQGLSLKTQAILIWAGQRAVEPNLKLRWVERFLRAADPRIRAILVTWAAADFTRAVLELAAARLDALNPPADPDDEDGEDL
ncbi:MAG: hypothetical protein CWE10_20115 [Symbiobacterium thermophilum]|uniref:Uncharacterized protein n=1 Tax=Symbiobacterium thermophilum TaxID=2734 RepID=A0A953LIL7_SYMTR|nr:hypothetical protein [Symbiobacterium thermophilum]